MKMMIGVSELGQDLRAILARVRRQGQSFLIEQDGEVVATLEPAGAARGATWGTLARTFREVPRADTDFAADLEEIQRSQSEAPAAMWPN